MFFTEIRKNYAFPFLRLSREHFSDADEERLKKGEKEIKKSLGEKWHINFDNQEFFPKTLSEVNPAVLEMLLSFEVVNFYDSLVLKFHFNQEQRNDIPNIIWQMVVSQNYDNFIDKFQEIGIKENLMEFEQILRENIFAKIKEAASKKDSKMIVEKIIFFEAETEEDTAEEEERSTVSLPVLQALSKYENLGNQLITQERIRIKTQGESVRPSLLYWLKYYRDELGIGQHNSVERGDFLFRSENGKNLSPEERERVNLILRSIEENLPLVVDTKRQEIVFPAFQGVSVPPRESGSGRPASNAVSVAPAGRPSQTTEQNVAGRENRNEAISMPTVAIPSVHLTPNQRQTFFHSVDPTETPRTTIQANIPSETGSVPSVQNDPGGMSFSSSHMFPAEKDGTEQKPQSTPHLFNPFTIHPVSRREEDDK